ncbi:translation protein SH3-like domain-containing protein [Melampsora americana]|nr:translation protein SH3-like domain-containing protein [Melampsora americana]
MSARTLIFQNPLKAQLQRTWFERIPTITHLSLQRTINTNSIDQSSTLENSNSSQIIKKKSYPFSDSVSITEEKIPKEPRIGLMQMIQKKLIFTSSNQEFQTLFKKNHPNSIRPLSILQVESYTNLNKTNTNLFTGVLMGIKRNGIETSFRLRCLIERVGIEIKFNLFSSMIKNIKVVKRSGEIDHQKRGKMLIPKPRRSKLYYLRDQPKKLPDIQKIIKTVSIENQHLRQLNEENQKNKS